MTSPLAVQVLTDFVRDAPPGTPLSSLSMCIRGGSWFSREYRVNLQIDHTRPMFGTHMVGFRTFRPSRRVSP